MAILGLHVAKHDHAVADLTPPPGTTIFFAKPKALQSHRWGFRVAVAQGGTIRPPPSRSKPLAMRSSSPSTRGDPCDHDYSI
jgi:hypothetical protein